MVNSFRRHVLTTVLVPKHISDPLEVLEFLMNSFGSRSDGWQLGGAWQSSYRSIINLLEPKDLKLMRAFADDNPKIYMNCYPAALIPLDQWMPQCVINPAGQMYWIETEGRKKWKPMVAKLYGRFKDCYAIVVDFLLPDDDSRPEFVVKKKRKGKAA